MNGWIKLFSKFQNWEWYKNQNVKDLFIHCLLKANWKDGKFEGILVPRGSFITSRKKLSEELGIPEQKIRTSLTRLKSTNEITIKTTNKYTLISVVNYNEYQVDEKKSTNDLTNTLTNKQPTTNHNLRLIYISSSLYKYIYKYKLLNNFKEEKINKKEESIYEFVEKNFMRTISPTEIEKIGEWKNIYPEDILKYATEKSVMANIKTFSYVEGILKNWNGCNYKTLADIKSSENKKRESFESKKVIDQKLFEYDWLNDKEET